MTTTTSRTSRRTTLARLAVACLALVGCVVVGGSSTTGGASVVVGLPEVVGVPMVGGGVVVGATVVPEPDGTAAGKDALRPPAPGSTGPGDGTDASGTGISRSSSR